MVITSLSDKVNERFLRFYLFVPAKLARLGFSKFNAKIVNNAENIDNLIGTDYRKIIKLYV